MNFDENTPIYLQISSLIKIGIVQGKYKPGDKMPSVRELSTELKVNPNTIQRAYAEIDREGILYTKRGMGTFVVEDFNIIEKLKVGMARNTVEKFLGEMDKLGIKTEEVIQLIKEIRRD